MSAPCRAAATTTLADDTIAANSSNAGGGIFNYPGTGDVVTLGNTIVADNGGTASTAVGPDVDGQMKRLRAYDGMHFTRAGQRKLAFYVETEIRKLMRGEAIRPEASAPEVIGAQPKPQAAMLAAPPPLPPAPWERVGPVMPLGQDVGGDSDLAGAPQSKVLAEAKPIDAAGVLPGGYPLTETPLYARVIEGEPIQAATGRVDDFTWKR